MVTEQILYLRQKYSFISFHLTVPLLIARRIPSVREKLESLISVVFRISI